MVSLNVCKCITYNFAIIFQYLLAITCYGFEYYETFVNVNIEQRKKLYRAMLYVDYINSS